MDDESGESMEPMEEVPLIQHFWEFYLQDGGNNQLA